MLLPIIPDKPDGNGLPFAGTLLPMFDGYY